MMADWRSSSVDDDDDDDGNDFDNDFDNIDKSISITRLLQHLRICSRHPCRLRQPSFSSHASHASIHVGQRVVVFFAPWSVNINSESSSISTWCCWLIISKNVSVIDERQSQSHVECLASDSDSRI